MQTAGKYQDIKNIQTKLNGDVDELQEQIKQNTISLEYSNSNITAKPLIDCHYNEILHHLDQIRHHLLQVNYHTENLEDIEINTYSPTKVLNGTALIPETQTDIQKRDPEEIDLSRSRRASKSSSLKYVLQWEKMLDEQKDENVLNSIKHRIKEGPNLTDNELVRNRVQKFEGFQKTKRMSSTIETFLDFSNEKPRRIKSYPIAEDLEGELDFEVSQMCDGDNLSKCISHSDLFSEHFSPTNPSNEISNDDISCTKTCFTETQGHDHGEAITNPEEKLDISTESISECNYSSKPRIIEIHYKQPVMVHEST